MPRYFIRSSHSRVSVRKVDLVLFPARDNQRLFGTEREIFINDLNLLFGAITSEFDNVKIISAQHVPYKISLEAANEDEAVEALLTFNRSLEALKANLQSHSVSQCHANLLESHTIDINVRTLNTLTERYGDKLSVLEQETDNPFGQLFRQYVNLEPDDDLTRQYPFLDGTRKLVIPRLGDYQRITLPEDLTCPQFKCRIGNINYLVKSLNNFLGQIDWQCLQIAHKMKEHQKTDSDGGPYWII